MRNFVSILLIGLTIPLISYQHKPDKSKEVESEKYLNFLAAVKNFSTFSYFTVIKVKNLNTGETKEICTKGNFLAGAIHLEFKLNYDGEGQSNAYKIAETKKDRYFEFKSKKALDNISFFDYKLNYIDSVKIKYDFDKVIDIITKEKKFSLRLSDDEMKAFAHVLFNRGFLTGEDSCWGGALEYVDRTRFGK